MKLLRTLLAEIRYHWGSALLSVLALGAAVAGVQFVVLLGKAADEETRVVQRDIGLNVLILPAETNLDRYWARGETTGTLPADVMEQLAQQGVANRLVPLLRRRIDAGGMDVLLTGIDDEIFKGGQKKKAVFGMDLLPGRVVIGGEVAARLGIGAGDALQLAGGTFEVARALSSGGSEEDITVYADLGEVQKLLGLAGRLSEIQAIECHCGDDVEDPLAWLRGELEPLLPGAQILRRDRLADARRAQRLAAQRQLTWVPPALVLLCGLLVGALAWLNVRERRQELGVLSALGHGPAALLALVLGRAGLLGVLGALAGSGAGLLLARTVAPRVFQVTGADGGPAAWLLALVGAPLLALVASLLPALLVSLKDPAEVLRDA